MEHRIKERTLRLELGQFSVVVQHAREEEELPQLQAMNETVVLPYNSE